MTHVSSTSHISEVGMQLRIIQASIDNYTKALGRNNLNAEDRETLTNYIIEEEGEQKAIKLKYPDEFI